MRRRLAFIAAFHLAGTAAQALAPDRVAFDITVAEVTPDRRVRLKWTALPGAEYFLFFAYSQEWTAFLPINGRRALTTSAYSLDLSRVQAPEVWFKVVARRQTRWLRSEPVRVRLR
jgi:hypothetical protein